MIQVFKPWIDDREIAAVTEVLKSGWLGLGPKTALFEERFADYVGARYAVGMNSGTAALHLALVALGIGPGDEVLVPTITFVSTAHVVKYCGATPVFVDVRPDTLCIDTDDAASRTTQHTKAIMPVHYAGHPCDMIAVWGLAKLFDLRVVEDAAHACGADYQYRKIGGQYSDAVCFSHHAVKNLTTGEGGMVTTNDEDVATALKLLRWCGIDKSTWDRSERIGMKELEQYGWYYEVARLGYKAHMSDIAAAIGLVQLEKLAEANDRRRQIVEIYQEAFSRLPWLDTPIEHDYAKSAWHAYVIRTGYRDALNLFLRDKGIATGVHYMPLHLQPYYASEAQPVLPVAEREWRRILTLPLYPSMTQGEVARVVNGVREFGGTL